MLAVSAIATAVTTTFGEWFVSALVVTPVQLLGFVIVALTVSFGERARWGPVLGTLLAGLLLFDATVAATEAFSALVATVVCSRVWVERHRARNCRAWCLTYAVTALATSLAVATSVAWVTDIQETAAFFVSLSNGVAMNLPAAIVGLPLVWALVTLRDETGWTASRTVNSSRERLVVSGVLLFWAVVGASVSGFVYLVQLVSSETLGRRLNAVVETISRFIVTNENHIQFVVGVVALVVVLFASHQSRSTNRIDS